MARPKQTQIAITRGCHNEKGSGHCVPDLSMSNQLAGEQNKFEPDRHLFCLMKVPHGLWLHQGWVLDVCIRWTLPVSHWPKLQAARKTSKHLRRVPFLYQSDHGSAPAGTHTYIRDLRTCLSQAPEMRSKTSKTASAWASRAAVIPIESGWLVRWWVRQKQQPLTFKVWEDLFMWQMLRSS